MAVSPFKEEAIAAIREHLATVGPSNWNVILEQFKDRVSEPTLWTWIRSVRNSADVPKPQLDAAADAIAKATAGKDIPVAPSPNYIARSGAQGLANLDFMVELKNLYSDGQLLRAYAMKLVKNPETGEETEAIKNPIALERSIARRASILETALKAMGEIWDLRMQQQFYEIIIDEIGKADPWVQKAILTRLAEVNARYGMTMAMRV